MALFLSALSFSLSSNLDNLVVGIAYGIKKVKIGIISNIIIAFVTSIGTYLSMLDGSYISKFLPRSFANAFGALVIIILGIYFIFQSVSKLIYNTKSKELALKNITDMIEYAQKSDLDNSGDINVKEALIVVKNRVTKLIITLFFYYSYRLEIALFNSANSREGSLCNCLIDNK